MLLKYNIHQGILTILIDNTLKLLSQIYTFLLKPILHSFLRSLHWNETSETVIAEFSSNLLNSPKLRVAVRVNNGGESANGKKLNASNDRK